MTATMYMVLSKLIIVLDADTHAPVPVKLIPKVFIFGDLVSLAAQLTGQLSNMLDNSYANIMIHRRCLSRGCHTSH